MASYVTMPKGLAMQLSATTDGTEPPATAPTVMLMTSAHDFDAASASEYVSDVVADEAAPTSYARTALAFASAITIDSNGRAQITWTDTSFGLLGGAVDDTLGGCYVFDATGNDATSRLLYAVPFTTPETTDGTEVIIRWTNPTTRTAP
jgi:hypothetical protein